MDRKVGQLLLLARKNLLFSQQTLNGDTDTQLALLHAKYLLLYLTLPAALGGDSLDPVLLRWPQCSEGWRAQPRSPSEEGTEPGAPGHSHTPGHKLRVLTGTHDNIHGEVGSGGHIHRYTIQHTAAPHHTQGCQTPRVTCKEITRTQ